MFAQWQGQQIGNGVVCKSTVISQIHTGFIYLTSHCRDLKNIIENIGIYSFSFTPLVVIKTLNPSLSLNIYTELWLLLATTTTTLTVRRLSTDVFAWADSFIKVHSHRPAERAGATAVHPH